MIKEADFDPMHGHPRFQVMFAAAQERLARAAAPD